MIFFLSFATFGIWILGFGIFNFPKSCLLSITYFFKVIFVIFVKFVSFVSYFLNNSQYSILNTHYFLLNKLYFAIATLPVRISSFIPNAFTSFKNSFTFSDSAQISKIAVSFSVSISSASLNL